ncbi:U3 small nucleolar RNA-associated protein 4 homolog [Argiope bruennichi]|uniref:U3 small nucleolar RNA-associated protein 4 homolog n=1 Tax=Argiope bruennichi TaxID=94029 RepID=UPI0024955EB4|nr:U3 small nucleolar RNA-associated protein 4 homolog [Argiope bruennichi]
MKSLKVHRVNFFEPEPQAIRCLSHDRTTSHLAVSRADSSIEIWDVKSNPYLEKVIPGTPATSVETLAWCNGRLFSAGLYGYITEYDLESLVPKYQLSVTSTCPIWCMKFDYEGKCLAVGNEDGHVVLHQLSFEGLDFDKKCDKQEGCILCLDWHKDGQFIVTGSIDAIRVWNVNNGHVVNRIILARASKSVPTVVWCVAVTSDMTIISGDSCGKTSFWDGNTGTLLSASGTQKDDVLTLVVNKDEDVIYTSGVDSTITMYLKSSNGMWLKSIQRVVHTHDVRALQFVGDYLVSGGDDCNLIFTKYPPKTTIKFFPFCQKSYCKVASNPSCILLTYPNFVEVWSIGTFSGNANKPTNLLRLKPKQNERIICSSLSSNGKWLAYASQLQSRLFCLKLETNSKDLPSFYKVSLPDKIPSSTILLFTSEPTKLILYSRNNIFIVKCDSMQPTIENTIETDAEDQVQLMELSHDDEHLACSYHSGKVTIYNLKSLKVQFKLPVYKFQATALKFDPSSENLLIAYSDRKIVEYSLEKSGYSNWSKQQVLLQFQSVTPHPITSICFCSDKIFLQDENTLYVFDRKDEIQPGKKKIKQSEDSSISITESDYKAITKYEHISSIDSFMEDLVVVQISSSRILDSLPPPVWKKKYGT